MLAQRLHSIGVQMVFFYAIDINSLKTNLSIETLKRNLFEDTDILAKILCPIFSFEVKLYCRYPIGNDYFPFTQWWSHDKVTFTIKKTKRRMKNFVLAGNNNPKWINAINVSSKKTIHFWLHIFTLTSEIMVKKAFIEKFILSNDFSSEIKMLLSKFGF